MSFDYSVMCLILNGKEGLFWVFKVGQALVRRGRREVEDKAEEEELPQKKKGKESCLGVYPRV